MLQAKLEVSELRHEAAGLRRVVAQYQEELRESSKLLLKGGRIPPRPFTNSTEKQLIAASQSWKCGSGDPDCPLILLTGGVFDQSHRSHDALGSLGQALGQPACPLRLV